MIRTLQSTSELDDARQSLRDRGLSSIGLTRLLPWQVVYCARFIARPLRPDVVKSWDVDTATRAIERHVPDRQAPILDMGCFNSEILYALHAAGYRHLHGIDLNPRCRWMPFWHRVRYATGDLTRTPYAANSFAAISCLSVIEHGVDVESLTTEVRRLLAPGGIFIVTTDYDGSGAPHHATAGRLPFGRPWRIFDRTSLESLIGTFRNAGLELLDDETVPGLQHDSRPVEWNGESYTFAFLAFRANYELPC